MNKTQIREGAQYVSAALVVLLVGFIMFHLFAGDIPANNHDAIMLALGTIFGWGSAVVGYYFGSSKGSADKSDKAEGKSEPEADPGK